MNEQAAGRGRPSRLYLVSTCCSLLALAGLTAPLAGCGDATAVAVDKSDVDAVRIRLAELTDRVNRLPAKNPEQVAAHTRLRTKLNNCKIQFKSKHLARLGSVTENVFDETRKEIDEIEAMIRRYPK